MKKPIALLAALLLCFSIAWAQDGYSNRQKIYPIGSEEYKVLTYLYVNQGKALPSSAGPWSADELIRMLDKIDASKLSDAAKLAYDRVAANLYAIPKKVFNDGFAWQFSMEAALEGYYHTNTTDFVAEGDWVNGFNERKALWKGIFETWPTDHFYSYFELPLGMNSGSISDGVNNLYSPAFGLNLPTSMAVLKNIDLNFPYRALFSLGGDHWNLEGGRDRLSWGQGETGNLMLGDNLRYQQFLKFTTYFDAFKFATVASFFTHPKYIGDSNQNTALEGFKMFLAHRVEFRLFGDRVGLSLNESIMYQSTTGTLDIRVLNPIGFFHNYYLRANANSMLNFEADWTILPGLNVYGQFAVDDFCFLEPNQPEASANPNAYGYLAGVKGALPLASGFLFYSLEGALTDPFLYLREKFDGTNYGVGYDVSLRVFNEGVQYLRNFIGYGYGNDAIVGDLRCGYKGFGKWSASAEAFYMLHGVMDMDSLWSSYHGTEVVPETPTTANPFETTAKNKVSTTLVLSAMGDYAILPRLSVDLRVDYIMIVNKGNIEKAPVTDTQVTLGLSYSL